jgi:hypothetical protein
MLIARWDRTVISFAPVQFPVAAGFDRRSKRHYGIGIRIS